MNQKGLAPLLIVILIALAVGGYLIYQKQTQPNPIPTPLPQQTTQPSPSPADGTANWKTYIGHGYTINYPAEYKLKEDKVNGWEKFYIPKIVDGEEDLLEEVMVSRHKTPETDICIIKLVGYPDASCIKINNISFLDWKSDVANVYGPINFVYSAINNGVLYEISFLGIDKIRKDQILSTFKLTQ